MFKLSTYAWCCCLHRCHVPRVRDHPTAVLHHLTDVPPHEPDAKIALSPMINIGSGTEEDPFVVYRDPQSNDRENLQRLRLVCISDTHNQIHRINIPHGDVFIHCGDAVKFYSSSRDIVVFNQFVGGLSHEHKIFISGNHCICFDPARPDLTQQTLSNMKYVQDELIDIKGLKIYGSPWRPKRGLIYPAEAFGYDSKLIRQDIWSQIPENIDILLTHGPPYSIRDYHPLTDECIGCPGLLNEVVTRVRPRIHLFGHMHTCRGASLYRSVDNPDFEIGKNSHDILFVNLASVQKQTLGDALVIDYYY